MTLVKAWCHLESWWWIYALFSILGLVPLHTCPKATFNYILLPLTALLLWKWPQSKTGESLSKTVVPTSKCWWFSNGAPKNARYSKNTQLNFSLITGTTRGSGNTSEIFQWAGEKSYNMSKKKYSQVHPHRMCFMFYSQGVKKIK